MAPPAAANLVDTIVAIATGRVAAPVQDASGWDSFYARYREAPPRERANVDHAFESLETHPDVEVRAAVLQHWTCAGAKVGHPRLLRLVEHERAIYGDERPGATRYSLRSLLLDALAATAPEGDDRTFDAIVSLAPGAGLLTRRVGTFLGERGPAAVAALVACAPADAIADAAAAAGYELHRRPERWAEARHLAASWPAPVREALERGGAAHAARFPG